MATLGIYSKETKELISEFEISDEVLELLKKQKDPSQTFEDIIKKWLNEQMIESEKTTQSY